MASIIDNREIADALIAGMEDVHLAFRVSTIPETPVSGYDPLNKIWYSPDVILCHNLEEIIIFANPAARDFFGNILGKPSVELVPNVPELRTKRTEALRRVIETGNPEYFDRSQRIGKEGQIVLVTGWAFRYRIGAEYSIGAWLLL